MMNLPRLIRHREALVLLILVDLVVLVGADKNNLGKFQQQFDKIRYIDYPAGYHRAKILILYLD